MVLFREGWLLASRASRRVAVVTAVFPVRCVRSFSRVSTGVATSGVVLRVMSSWGATASCAVDVVGGDTVVKELRGVGQLVLLWW
mgnify:FL=1